MNRPTNDVRLRELMGIFETATTDGECRLDGDQIGDVYLWLQWAQQEAEKTGVKP